MTGLFGIIIAFVVAVVLSPFILKLARRWHRGTAAFAAGSVAGGAIGEGGGIGSYITRLRTGRNPDDADSDSDGTSSDVDSTGFDADSTGGDSHSS